MEIKKYDYHQFVVQNFIDGKNDYNIKANSVAEAYKTLLQFLIEMNRIKSTKAIVYKGIVHREIIERTRFE